MAYYPRKNYHPDPTTDVNGPNNTSQNTSTVAFEEEKPPEIESDAPDSVWTKSLIVVGLLLGAAFIAIAIIIPVYLVPLLTLKPTTLQSTTTTTSTSSTTSTTTTSVTTTTAVTLYVPSNYWTACSVVCTNVTTTTASTLLASWKFENNVLDSTGSYNGYMTTSTTYTSGYINQALVVNSAQYVTVSAYLSFYSRSFTIEAWIYVTSLTSSTDYGIFGQCQSTATRTCLQCIIRSNKIYMGFFGDDISGSTTLSTNVWMHVAFAYDMTTNTKSVYLNGILDGSTTSGSSYQGTSGIMYVGYATDGSSMTPLPGYIDQVTISNRAKIACEILNDASLVSRFSFDSNTLSDSGPNGLTSYIAGQLNPGMSYTTGRINQGLLLSTTNSFFQSGTYVALGVNNQPFSFALWINPTDIGGTLIHVSSDRTGSGSWCLPHLGFSLNGSVVAQSWHGSVVSVIGPQIPTSNWIHVAQTWSSTNGLRLYINGALYGSSAMSTYNNNNGPMYIFVGTSGFGTDCHTSDIVMDTYSGAFDEFYVYNRELTPSEICPLAHP